MQRRAAATPRWYLWFGVALAAALMVWARRLVWQAAVQLFIGMIIALAGLPLMRWLERRVSTGLAATLSMASLAASLIAFVLLLVPPLIEQGEQLVALLPAMYASAERLLQAAQGWLSENGIELNLQMRDTLLARAQELLGAAAPGLMAWVSGAAGSLSKWMLAPVFSYYFLRDRRRIGQWLLTLVPVGRRATTVRILREMKRETAGYLRGQLMVSAVVGVLTALGLMLCGVPAWLVLGAAMGVLELIPYVGPFLGGLLAVLFALPGGMTRTLWALGVVLVVQQLEGGLLSPQLMSDATRLHPILVVLCVMLGGSAAGVTGILLAVPILLCARGALRVLAMGREG